MVMFMITNVEVVKLEKSDRVSSRPQGQSQPTVAQEQCASSKGIELIKYFVKFAALFMCAIPPTRVFLVIVIPNEFVVPTCANHV